MHRRFLFSQSLAGAGAAKRSLAIMKPGAMITAPGRLLLSAPWAAIHASPWLLFSSILRAEDKGKNNSSNDNSNKNKKGDKKNDEEEEDNEADPQDITPKVLRFVLGTTVLSIVLYWMAKPSTKPVSWEEVMAMDKPLERLDIYKNYVEFYFEGMKPMVVGLLDDDEHTNQMVKKTLEKVKTKENFATNYIGTSMSETLLHLIGTLAWIAPFIFFPTFVMILTRTIGSAMEGVQGAQRNNMFKIMFKVEKGSSTRFTDIAGMTEAKQEVTEIVDFLKYPDRYTKLGAKIPTGALLLGPPGTGKTLLAKAVAGEAGVAFIPATGSDFVELYAGMGALRVRQLFELAKKQRCIVYIDEIDAIGMKRTGAGHGEKQEQEHTLNELLTQLDGFGSARGEVMVLASSNADQSHLDPALIRPGRFDRLVHVDTPVIKERIDIFKVHLSNLKLIGDGNAIAPADVSAEVGKDTEKAAEGAEAPKVECTALVPIEEPANMEELETADRKMQEAAKASLEAKLEKLTPEERALVERYAVRMSDLCPGFVGADIANVCNEAAILAAREECDRVDISHLERSIDRVLAGIEHRSRVLSPFEKRVVAHHEAGHAVAGWFLGRADPLKKVSIVPRGGSALGYAQYLPNENHLRTSNEIKDSICVALGGRIAEKIFFNHLSTGASDDLRKVTRMAYQHVSLFDTTTAHHAPGTSATRYVKPFGAAISNKIDTAAKKLVDDLYEKTYQLLLEHKDKMEQIAKHLLEHEVLTHEDVVRYLGERAPRPQDRRSFRNKYSSPPKTEAAKEQAPVTMKASA